MMNFRSEKEKGEGQLYQAICSDAYVQSSISPHDESVLWYLGLCVSTSLDGECEGLLYPPDRIFDRRCYFEHGRENEGFEESENVVGYKQGVLALLCLRISRIPAFKRDYQFYSILITIFLLLTLHA